MEYLQTIGILEKSTFGTHYTGQTRAKYELARDIVIEIAANDTTDYFDITIIFDFTSGGIFDGRGHSITINHGYGIVNGVEVNPATLPNTR